MNDSQDTASGRSLRSTFRAYISELDVRILALETSLAAARRERENLQSRLDDCKYPVLTLPVEITAEIFINFIPIYPLRPPLTGLLSPALLGQVCHKWRDVALGTPRLWRAIHVYVASDEESTLDVQLNALSTWLSRSKHCSLSLSFEMVPYLVFPTLPHFTAALVSQSERWEYVRLIIPFDNLRWLDRSFPLLRDLTFGPSHYSTTEGILAFRDAPQLKGVALGVMFDPSRVVLPWSQLTSIDAVEIEPVVAADILRQATALTKFTCTLWGNTVPEAVPPLIHLESLILNARSWVRTQKLLLDALTAPALRHLALSEHELGDEPISTITSLLSRSHCSLDSLRVSHSSRQEADYRAVFRSIKVIDVSPLDTDFSSDESEAEEEEDSDDDDDD